ANHFTHLPEVRQHFSAGILFQFCGDNPLDSIVSELGDKVGLALGDLPPERALTSLKSHFAQCRCLLILDDVRADDLEALLPGGHCSVMLTSRRRDLAMLAENDPIDLEIFTEKECLNLLREFLGQKLDGHDAEARELCKKLGYLPMAVSVAAGLLRDVARMSFARLLEKLSDPDSGGLSVLQHRQRNVEHLLQTALDALDSEAELLLCAMAVCAEEGFRFEWPLQVSELPEARAETALQTLLDRSLLRELDRDAERYQLHTLVRQVAQKRPPTTPLPPRHAEFAEQQFAEKLTNWRTLLDDLPEARQAILWGVDEKKEYPTFLLGYYGYELCRRTGRLQEALEFMQDYQQFSDQLDDRDRLQRSYGNQALILKAWGKLDEAMKLHKKKEKLCIELGNKDSLQICYGNQALILQAWGQLDEAMKLHKKQEMICIELGNKDSLWRCLTNQATIFRDQKEYGQAIQLLEQVESICGELGSKEGLAYCYWNMATVLHAQKHTTQARERAAEALRLFTEIGMPVQIKAVQKLLESL
ncbi:MAG: tetratricopeptide repeat protein, partial [Deferribacteres bacterium]|nr:tetratricopeptide repeat protein [Deferribacteres bacterium]